MLDIGSGWGSLALDLAGMADVFVTGVTLAPTQREVAVRRARAAKLDRLVTFELQDYREVEGRFDRIVSVGMLEHVGKVHLGTYFEKVGELLDEDGIALVHSIGRSDGWTGTDGFTDRYIFPGGFIPALGEVLPAVESSGLVVTDIEVLRLHYAKTLAGWLARFETNREEARAMMGERFCRMWEFYLAAAEVSFRHHPLMVFQLQLAHRKDAVPLTRDYMTLAEARYATIRLRRAA